MVLKEPGKDDKMLFVRIRSDAIVFEGTTVELMPTTEPPPRSLQGIAKMEEGISTGQVFKVILKYKPDRLITDGLFAVHNTGDATIQDLLARFQAIFSEETLEMYVRCVSKLDVSFDAFHAIIDGELATNPLDAWQPVHPNLHYVQLGEHAPVEERPVIEVKAQFASPSISDYATIMGYGAIGEHEVGEDRITAINDTTFHLTLINVPGAGLRRYIGLIDSDVEIPFRFHAGETLKVNFDPEANNRAEDWSAVVIEPLPFAGFQQTCIVVYRPRLKGSEEYDVRVLPDTIQSTFSDDKSIRAACERSKKMDVRLWIEAPKKALKRQLTALKEIQSVQTHLHTTILGAKYTRPQSVDILGSINTGNIEELIARRVLSQTQKEALSYCRSLPFGIGLIQGPPGTGKSHWCSEIVHLFLLLQPRAKQPHQVLVTAPTNSCVDELTEKIADVFGKDAATKDKIVIRLHTIDTEADIISMKAKGERDAPGPVISEDGLDAILAEFEIARTVLHAYRRTERPTSAVADKRVKLTTAWPSGCCASPAASLIR